MPSYRKPSAAAEPVLQHRTVKPGEAIITPAEPGNVPAPNSRRAVPIDPAPMPAPVVGETTPTTEV